MSASSDSTAIPIALACELVGVSRQLRKTWISRRLIVGRSSGVCDEEQILDLSAFSTLVASLGFDTARLIWPQVRSSVRGAWDAEQIDVVVDLKRIRGVLATDDTQVGAAARHGNLTRVVALAQVITGIREDFRALGSILDETNAID
jgi:hypothetical protein